MSLCGDDAVYVNCDTSLTFSRSQYLHAALRIPYFKDVYGTLNYRNERIGYTVESPVIFSNIGSDEFMIILKFLKLYIEFGGDAVCNEMGTLSAERLIRYTCICSKLYLMDLCSFFMHRTLYLLNKNYDTAKFVMECLVKHTSYSDLLIFHKQLLRR
jgi:hypothetical protein